MSRVVWLFMALLVLSVAADSRLVLNCPLPQLGQNTTSVSVFLYVDGQPTTNQTMALDYVVNSTSAFETLPVSVDVATGRHVFIIDSSVGGNYSLVAHSGVLASNTCSLDVYQQQSTPLPDLSPGLTVLVGVMAFYATRRKTGKRPSNGV